MIASSDDEDDDDLQEFLGTTSFGARIVERDINAAYARTKRQVENFVYTRDKTVRENAEDSDSVEDSSEEEAEGEDIDLPISHEILLKSHTRPVSGLSLDHAATRIVSGAHDGKIALWDFGGMTAEPRAFKVLEPFESHQVRSVDFNSTGDAILMTAANWQPKVITREGEDIAELPRGDPYLREMKNTRGHVGEVTSGSWNPKNKTQFITSSADSTIRLWEFKDLSKCQQVLVHKPKAAGAGKVKCSAAAYSHDGKTIGGAYVDGTISLWATDGPYHRPMGGSVADAHIGSDVSCLAFSMDGWSMASRSSDSVKLWDRRKFSTPIAQKQDLRHVHEETNIIYSPNNQELLTGVTGDSSAHLLAMSSKSLEPIVRIPFDSPVVKVLYTAKINQILTGHASGDIHVLYSPETSVKGAKLVVSRAPKTRHVDDLVTADINEAVLDTVEDPSTAALAQAKLRNQTRRDPIKSQMPSLPDSRRRTERIVNAELTSFRDQDPREALLAYDEKAKKDPKFFGVYNKTQPIAQFAETEEDAQDDTETQASKRFKFTPKQKK